MGKPPLSPIDFLDIRELHDPRFQRNESHRRRRVDRPRRCPVDPQRRRNVPHGVVLACDACHGAVGLRRRKDRAGRVPRVRCEPACSSGFDRFGVPVQAGDRDRSARSGGLRRRRSGRYRGIPRRRTLHCLDTGRKFCDQVLRSCDRLPASRTRQSRLRGVDGMHGPAARSDAGAGPRFELPE